MKKYSWISAFLLLTSLQSFAQIPLKFHGKQARQLWYFLDESKRLGGNVISEGTMGTSHLSSPIIKCHKTNPANFNPPKPAQDPSLYSCDITLDITLGLETITK